MKIYNRELEFFIQFLYNLKLAGKASRMRTRLMNLLIDKYKLFEDERNQLILEHCNLDQNGNPIQIEEDGIKKYDVKDIYKFNLDMKELLNEEVVIEENESNKEMLLSVRDSLLNCEIEFEGDEAIRYDRYCTIMENIYNDST